MTASLLQLEILRTAKQPFKRVIKRNIAESNATLFFHDEHEETDSSDDADDGEWIIDSDSEELLGVAVDDNEYRIGDIVLMENGTKRPFVVLLFEFLESEDGERLCKHVWFTQNHEIMPLTKRRTDTLPGEIFITSSIDQNPVEAIIGHTQILSEKTFNKLSAQHNSQKRRQAIRGLGKNTFICRRGLQSRSMTYTDTFDWDVIYASQSVPMRRIDALTQFVEAARRGIDVARQVLDQYTPKQILHKTKNHRKRTRQPKEASSDDEFEDTLIASESENDDALFEHSAAGTPRKYRHSHSQTTTPVKTPRKIYKPLLVTPMPLRTLPKLSTPYQKARAELQAASIPQVMPCREDQFMQVYSLVEQAIIDLAGICIYISGTPGTGKTATVRSVIRSLRAKTEAGELDEFVFVEINGMKLVDPTQAYSLLWAALMGERVSSSGAHDQLEQYFGVVGPSRVSIIVLMDELDQLVTKDQKVMYNFFNWPSLPNSRLIVLAVANTMDLPERMLSNRISSRMGLSRIIFEPYSYEQLKQIILSRLQHDETVPLIFDENAIEFCARKIASVTGDARRALDVCRRAVELAEVIHQQQADVRYTRVSTETVRRAISEMIDTPEVKFLESMPFLAKLIVVSLYNRSKRRTEAQSESVADCIEEACMVLSTSSHPLRERLLAGNTGTISGWNTAVQHLIDSGIVTAEHVGSYCRSVRTLRLKANDLQVYIALQADSNLPIAR